MAGIVRAEPGWQERIARALAGAERPISVDERLLPRTAAGDVRRTRHDRAAFPPPRPAATLIAIYPDTGGALLLPLTVRRDELRSHAGEVSLPGGAVDASDDGPQGAALREAWEEIGLEPRLASVAGMLDPVWIPVTNYELRPVVATLDARPALVPQDSEVAAIVELPLAALYDEKLRSIERFESRGTVVHAGAYLYAGLRVWGATAITLGMLAHVLGDTGNDAQRRS